jgi:CRISPR-associated protein Csd1
MILKRLCEAADQLQLPPQDYAPRKVSWLVSIDTEGRLLGFIQTTDEKGRGIERCLPELSVRRSGKTARPRVLADTADYVLGCPAPDADDDFTEAKHTAFCELVADCADATESPQLAAVQRFLADGLSCNDLPCDMSAKDWVTFQVGAQILVDMPEVRTFWVDHVLAQRADRSDTHATCLVCGDVRAIADRHPIAIVGVPGAGGQSALVSTNAESFYSHGRKHALVSPVCWTCAYTYAQALNAMLADEQHSFRLRDQLVWVFWTRQPTRLTVAALLSDPQPEDIRLLLESVEKGRRVAPLAPDFYALALSGSEGRVVIRDWLETTVEAAHRNIARYFRAQEIVGPDGQPGEPIKLRSLMEALIPSVSTNRWKHLPPDLAAAVVHAALTGGNLPDQLLHLAVGRARSESDVQKRRGRTIRGQKMTRERAAVIKMCLALSSHPKEGFDVTPEMNSEIQDPAYLCGRLLALFERIQYSAQGWDLNSTIVDKYYGTASTAPASVFGNLMRQSQNHLSKLRRDADPKKQAAATALQRRLEEIAAPLSVFPNTLNLMDQGKFGLGYYHQRAADTAAANENKAANMAASENQAAGEES